MDHETTKGALEPVSVRETLADYRVRKAREAGAFDNLPGTGKPIADLDEPYDELWWAKKLIEREELKAVFKEQRRTDARESQK